MIKTLRNVVIINAKLWKQHRDILHSHFILHFKHTSSNISTLIKNTLYKMDIKKMWHSLKGQAGVYLESSLNI